MTFTHALSRRLALLRDAATVAALVVVASCDLFSPVDTSGLDVAQVVVVPGTTTLEPKQNYQFAGYGRTQTGDSVAVALVWSATGGTISSSGRYIADSLEGDYEVRATLARPTADAAASSGSSVVRLRKLAQLAVTPASATLPTRGTQAFAAYGRLNGGDSVAVSVTWTATGGTISSTGLYTAGPTPGANGVTASGRGFTATATVTLTSIPVASVSVSPTSATLALGATQQLSAVTKDSAGNTLTGRVVTWSSSNPTFATVSGSGLVAAIAAGSATITATSEGKNGTSAITVQAPAPGSHQGYYVAPTGSPTGDGSATRPWNLATALAHPAAVQPGDTIWLRGGTYTVGQITSSLAGTVGSPIIVRQYPGERAIINGWLAVNGSDTWYWGFEVLTTDNVSANRIMVDVHSPRSRLINLIVHEGSGDGIGLWTESPDAVLYGSLIYNNGWQGSSPTSRGHGVYFQNRTGTKLLKHNIVFNNYSHNFHGYATAGFINNFTLEDNISFNAASYTTLEGGREFLVGASNPVQNLTFRRNLAFCDWPTTNRFAEARFGLYEDFPNPDGSVVTDNYIYGLVRFAGDWEGGDFLRNTLLTPAGDGVQLRVETSGVLANFNWNNNTYHHNWLPNIYQNFFLTIGLNGGNFLTFANWRAQTGFDAASTYDNIAPTGQHIVVHRNEYEAKRANVAVYNYSGAATAPVDLSTILKPGDYFEVREVQNYFGPPVLSGSYTGGTLNFPMAAVTAPPPLVPQEFPAYSTGTKFHAFVVLGK
jgi:hypothetical protein